MNLKKMNKKTKKTLLWITDIVANVIIIFVLVIVIQKWIIAPFDVSGASMCDTLNFIDGKCVNDYGEKIIINEIGYLFSEPERGDIVVFQADEDDEKYFIKRIIGLPGETVKIEKGQVYISPTDSNDKFILEENYLNDYNKGNTKNYLPGLHTYEVPENSYFVLGDNRNASTDSRSCFESSIRDNDCRENRSKSFIPKDLIRGKAWIIWWPLKNISIVKDPVYEIASESLEEK